MKAMLYDSPVKGIPTLQWGSDHEDVVRCAYEEKRKVKVATRGLVLDECGYLGCSPDGVVFEGDNGKGLLEIKCRYAARDLLLEDACLCVDIFCGSLGPDSRPSLKGTATVTTKYKAAWPRWAYHGATSSCGPVLACP